MDKNNENLEIGVKIKLYNNNLKKRRIEMGFKTIASFSRACGIDQNRLCSFETMRAYPTLTTAEIIADYLKSSVDNLFPDILKKIKTTEQNILN